MTKLFLPTLLLALATTTAFAQDMPPPPPPPGPPPPAAGDDSAHYGWADVLRVDPVYGVTRTEVPQQTCYNQTVVQQNPGNTTGGTILGAVVGGVLGNTIGRGGGRVAATAVGAVAGGAVGGQIAANSGSQTAQTVTNCQPTGGTVVSEQRRIMGYDVEYRYRGEVYVSRLSYDPGERLRVRVSVTPAD
jgi:uncharacterized protein YcfJ